MKETYCIKRFYYEQGCKYYPYRIIRKGLVFGEAEDHCRNPETSSSTCTNSRNHRHTQEYGAWFDGFDLETKCKKQGGK